MLDGLINTVLEQWLRLLRDGQATAIESALDALFNMPSPPISSDFFQSLYARAWALSILVALVTGAIGAIRALANVESEVSVAQSLFYFVRILIFGFLIPLLVGVGVWLSEMVTESTLLLADGDVISDMSQMSQSLEVVDLLFAILLGTLNWIFGWILYGLVLFFTWGILPIMVFAIATSSLRPLSKRGESIGEWSYSWLLVGLSALPIISLILIIANTFVVAARTEVGLEVLAEILSTIALFIAIYIPWRLKRAFSSSQLPRMMESVTSIRVVQPSIAADSNVRTNTMAVTSGVRQAQQFRKESYPDGLPPGSGRQVVAHGLRTAASMLPNKLAAGAGIATASLLDKSAEKAKQSKGEEDHV